MNTLHFYCHVVLREVGQLSTNQKICSSTPDFFGPFFLMFPWARYSELLRHGRVNVCAPLRVGILHVRMDQCEYKVLWVVKRLENRHINAVCLHRFLASMNHNLMSVLALLHMLNKGGWEREELASWGMRPAINAADTWGQQLQTRTCATNCSKYWKKKPQVGIFIATQAFTCLNNPSKISILHSWTRLLFNPNRTSFWLRLRINDCLHGSVVLRIWP